jgi:Cobalt transport protein.
MLSLPPAILIALPSLILNPSGNAIPTLDFSISISKVEAFLAFLLRVYTASFNVVLLTSVISLPHLASTLVHLKIPRSLVLLLTLSIINLFIALKNMNNRILGFRSRFKGDSIVELWKVQLKSIVLMLADGEAYTHNLRLAMASRGFTINSYFMKLHRVKIYDVMFMVILATLTLIILLIDGRLLWNLL